MKDTLASLRKQLEAEKEHCAASQRTVHERNKEINILKSKILYNQYKSQDRCCDNGNFGEVHICQKQNRVKPKYFPYWMMAIIAICFFGLGILSQLPSNPKPANMTGLRSVPEITDRLYECQQEWRQQKQTIAQKDETIRLQNERLKRYREIRGDQ